MNPLQLMQKRYLRAQKIKDALLSPIIRMLSYANISPDMVNYFGVLMAIIFLVFIKQNIALSLLFLFLAVSADLIDGALARFRKIASDRGKFIDMVCDNLIFTIFVIALIYANLATLLTGIVLVYLMVVSKLFRCTVHSFYLKSDWYFKPVAGFLPNLIVYSSYLLFLIFVITQKNYFDSAFILFSIILGIDAIIFYEKIISLKKK
ncbi:MAG: CDP-alcohol phosphatidyltransferase family protein [Candidatus Thorarchaeota archaeon]|jgi:phosphatidylglycerophosphate synthase